MSFQDVFGWTYDRDNGCWLNQDGDVLLHSTSLTGEGVNSLRSIAEELSKLREENAALKAQLEDASDRAWEKSGSK